MKPDRIELNSTKRLGYYLHTSLLMSDRTGAPLAPLHASLWASDGIQTTRSERVLAAHPHVDEATYQMEAVVELELGKPHVYLMDRGFDSVGHFRAWNARKRRFVTRANTRPRVEHEGVTMALGEAANQVTLRLGEAIDLSAGVTAQQFVGETKVVLRRAAKPRKRLG